MDADARAGHLAGGGNMLAPHCVWKRYAGADARLKGWLNPVTISIGPAATLQVETLCAGGVILTFYIKLAQNLGL